MKKKWRSEDWKGEDWKGEDWKIGDWKIGRVLVNLALSSVFVLMLGGCSTSHSSHEHDTYTCPMHPTVVSDRPGVCPVCGMSLVRKGRSGEKVTITEDLANLIKSPNEVIVSSIQTIKGEFKTMPVVLEAPGIVTYDTRNIYTIPARIGGRLEKVFLKYAFQPVRKGQKVAEIYSPELSTAKRELVYLIENDPGNRALIAAAKNKLDLLGATRSQVENMTMHKDETSTFVLYSPYDGYVLMENQLPPALATGLRSPEAMGGGMGKAGTASTPLSPAVNTSPAELIREGNYVSAGQILFKVVNTSAVRVELDLPVAQSSRVKMNDEVDLDFGNQNTVKGNIDFIQPFFTVGEEFTKVRLYVKNNGELRLGQLVRATIQLKPAEALWVPLDAILDLGLNKTVFVKEREVFKAKNVKTGVQTNGWVEIIQGLSSSDEIASHAQYLVDSESFVKRTTIYRSITEPEKVIPSQGGANDLMLSDSQIQLANITTQRVSVKPVGQTRVVNARLAENEELSEVVSSRAAGRIEKLFVKETGRMIYAGEPLYELYSETLLTLQREYLLANEQYETLGKNESRYKSFAAAAERKLLLYGLTKKQVETLAQSRSIQERVTFLAPAGGIVSEIDVSEGQYLEEGTALYRIQNISRLWLEAELYPDEAALVKPGDNLHVRVSGFESAPVDAKVIFKSPEYRSNSQIAILRALVDNPEMKFKPGMQAQVFFTYSWHDAVAIPIDAIIRSGGGAHVYVEIEKNTFQPRMVQTGLEDFERVEITEGLHEGDRIAVSGAYLLYSEIILKKGTDPMAGHNH